MNCKTLYFLCWTFSGLLLHAQPPIEWQQSAGSGVDKIFSLEPTFDSGYITVGHTNANECHECADVVVIKRDRNGLPLWRKVYGGTYYDEARSIRQTFDGGFILAGQSNSKDGNITGHHGNLKVEDCWIIKIDKEGNIEWERSVGGDGEDYCRTICQAPDGGYVFAGLTGSSATGDIVDTLPIGAMFVAKLSTTGSLLWLKTFPIFDEAYCIEPTFDSGFVVVARGALVLKLDSIGTLQWQRQFGGQGDDYFFRIRQTTDSGYICAGSSSSSNGDLTHNFSLPGSGYHDAWLMRLDAQGNRIWGASYGGIDHDEMKSIVQTGDGGFIAAGSTRSPEHDVTGYHGPDGFDAWVIKLSPQLDIEWNKAYGGSGDDYGTDIVNAFDGGYVFVGSAGSNNGDIVGITGADVWLVKLGGQSNVAWGPHSPEAANGILVTNDLLSLHLPNKGEYFTLHLYNILGQEVRSFNHTTMNNNDYVFDIDVNALAAGTYTYILKQHSLHRTGKFIVR